MYHIEDCRICRLCLAEDEGESLTFIFDPKGYNGFRVWEILKELLRFEISIDDGLPATICRVCLNKVLEFKRFKTVCIKSKISFLTMIVSRGLVKKSEDSVQKCREEGLLQRSSSSARSLVGDNDADNSDDECRVVEIIRTGFNLVDSAGIHGKAPVTLDAKTQGCKRKGDRGRPSLIEKWDGLPEKEEGGILWCDSNPGHSADETKRPPPKITKPTKESSKVLQGISKPSSSNGNAVGSLEGPQKASHAAKVKSNHVGNKVVKPTKVSVKKSLKQEEANDKTHVQPCTVQEDEVKVVTCKGGDSGDQPMRRAKGSDIPRCPEEPEKQVKCRKAEGQPVEADVKKEQEGVSECRATSDALTSPEGASTALNDDSGEVVSKTEEASEGGAPYNAEHGPSKDVEVSTAPYDYETVAEEFTDEIEIVEHKVFFDSPSHETTVRRIVGCRAVENSSAFVHSESTSVSVVTRTVNEELKGSGLPVAVTEHNCAADEEADTNISISTESKHSQQSCGILPPSAVTNSNTNSSSDVMGIGMDFPNDAGSRRKAPVLSEHPTVMDNITAPTFPTKPEPLLPKPINSHSTEGLLSVKIPSNGTSVTSVHNGCSDKLGQASGDLVVMHSGSSPDQMLPVSVQSCKIAGNVLTGMPVLVLRDLVTAGAVLIVSGAKLEENQKTKITSSENFRNNVTSNVAGENVGKHFAGDNVVRLVANESVKKRTAKGTAEHYSVTTALSPTSKQSPKSVPESAVQKHAHSPHVPQPLAQNVSWYSKQNTSQPTSQIIPQTAKQSLPGNNPRKTSTFGSQSTVQGITNESALQWPLHDVIPVLETISSGNHDITQQHTGGYKMLTVPCSTSNHLSASLLSEEPVAIPERLEKEEFAMKKPAKASKRKLDDIQSADLEMDVEETEGNDDTATMEDCELDRLYLSSDSNDSSPEDHNKPPASNSSSNSNVSTDKACTGLTETEDLPIKLPSQAEEGNPEATVFSDQATVSRELSIPTSGLRCCWCHKVFVGLKTILEHMTREHNEKLTKVLKIMKVKRKCKAMKGCGRLKFKWKGNEGKERANGTSDGSSEVTTVESVAEFLVGFIAASESEKRELIIGGGRKCYYCKECPEFFACRKYLQFHCNIFHMRSRKENKQDGKSIELGKNLKEVSTEGLHNVPLDRPQENVDRVVQGEFGENAGVDSSKKTSPLSNGPLSSPDPTIYGLTIGTPNREGQGIARCVVDGNFRICAKEKSSENVSLPTPPKNSHRDLPVKFLQHVASVPQHSPQNIVQSAKKNSSHQGLQNGLSQQDPPHRLPHALPPVAPRYSKGLNSKKKNTSAITSRKSSSSGSVNPGINSVSVFKPCNPQAKSNITAPNYMEQRFSVTSCDTRKCKISLKICKSQEDSVEPLVSQLPRSAGIQGDPPAVATQPNGSLVSSWMTDNLCSIKCPLCPGKFKSEKEKRCHYAKVHMPQLYEQLRQRQIDRLYKGKV